ncbi:MAG: DUF4176 domain-containing protein [bacterium]|nr:DUF4176 domain-containing protein [bacterium]
MKIQDLLPIGSVVLLEEGEKRLMIYGVKQTEQDTQIEYDYIGVVYPEGNMGKGTQFLFNHEQIKEICFRGFEDNERTDFIERLADYYEQKE